MEFGKLFLASKGEPIMYKGRELKMYDRITLTKKKVSLKVQFLKTYSHYTQGIIIETKGVFKVLGKEAPFGIILWEDTAPEEIVILVESKDKEIIIYNAWKTEDGTVEYGYNGTAMHVEYFDNYRIYNCNDGWPDDDMNDLIFKVEYFYDESEKNSKNKNK